ncbi:MAG: hemerythrin domain-containing protein [Microthrixaceae bacterium]
MDPNAPADTDMMRIVHDALRRDLRRAREALTHDPAPEDRQFGAIAEHLAWMMGFLHAHHRSEDNGLFPLVHERDPSAAPLLDEMADDHDVVAAAIDRLETAVRGRDPVGTRDSIVEAIDHLCELLLPHLEREEHDVMPVVSRAITNAEWQAVEEEHNLDGKSMSQLGMEGHWLIDGASAKDRDRVLGLVPWLPRLALLYGFGPLYRRRQRACWNPRRRRVQHDGTTAVVVDADIDSVWEVVRDPTRVGEWSHECVASEWVGAIRVPRPGARFVGRNRQGLVRWGRLCEVKAVDPFEIVWRTVPTTLYPDITEWAIRLEATAHGTRIEQTFHVVRGSKLEPLYATLVPAHRDRNDLLREDLRRIGDIAEGIAVAVPR